MTALAGARARLPLSRLPVSAQSRRLQAMMPLLSTTLPVIGTILISKPSEIVAAAAADVAVTVLKGETPTAETTLYDTPSQMLVPAVITAENSKVETRPLPAKSSELNNRY
jgi:ABC-type xylose transport system substrate-binding protein